MSRIQQIQPNYQQKAILSSSYQNYAKNPSFGGSADEAGEFISKLATSFKKGLMTKDARVNDFLALNEGEIETQLINNLFTATLAPTMIALNPFSNKPKKDKEYVAFRQFVSVLVALGFTAPITMLVDKQISKIGSEGDIKSIDMRMAPQKNYLKGAFKKAYKNASSSEENKISFEKEIGMGDELVQELRDRKGLINKLYYKASLQNAFVDNEQKKAKNFLGELINRELFKAPNEITTIKGETEGEFYLLDKNGSRSIKFIQGDGSKKNPSLITLLDDKGNPLNIGNSKIDGKELKGRIVPKINTIDELKAYINKNNLHNRTFGDFMKESFGFAFQNDGKTLKKESGLNKLTNISAKNFLEILGIIDKNTTSEELTKLLSTARQEKTVKDIKESVPVKTEKFVSSMVKQNIRDYQAQVGEKALKESNMSLNQLINRLDILDINDNAKDLQEEKYIKLQELMDKPLAEAMDLMKQKLVKNGFGKGLESEKGVKSISERFVKKSVEVLNENFKNTSKLYSLASAGIITAFACMILNWAYPRIIEKFFPSLLVKDKPSETKKGGK